MAERAGAAIHIDDVMRQAQIAHRRHGDDGESFVDLIEIDIARPASRPPRSSLRMAWIGAVVNQAGSWAWLAHADNSRDRLDAAPGCLASRISTSAAAPSEIERNSPPSPCRPSRKAGLSCGILSGLRRKRLLVLTDRAPPLARRMTLTGAISAPKAAVLIRPRLARSSEASAKCVLLLARVNW